MKLEIFFPPDWTAMMCGRWIEERWYFQHPHQFFHPEIFECMRNAIYTTMI